MSALGQKRTFKRFQAMSALLLIADIVATTLSLFSISPRYLAITYQNSGPFNRSNAPYRRGAVGDSGMRPSSLTYILFGVLIIAATYWILGQSPFPYLSPDKFDVRERIHRSKNLTHCRFTKKSHAYRPVIWRLRMLALTNSPHLLQTSYS
jgi:hypothetical protein